MTEVERIARMLCEADGCDPDMIVLPAHEPLSGPFGRKVLAAADLGIAWELYQDYVRATLDAAGESDAAAIVPPPPEPQPASWRDRYHLT